MTTELQPAMKEVLLSAQLIETTLLKWLKDITTGVWAWAHHQVTEFF